MSYSLTVTEQGVRYVDGPVGIDAHCVMDKGHAVCIVGFVSEGGRRIGAFSSVRGLYRLMECYDTYDLPQLVEGLKSHAQMVEHGAFRPSLIESLAYPIGIGEG